LILSLPFERLIEWALSAARAGMAAIAFVVADVGPEPGIE